LPLLKPPKTSTSDRQGEYNREVYKALLALEARIAAFSGLDELTIATMLADIAALQTADAAFAAGLADHESRIDALEAAPATSGPSVIAWRASSLPDANSTLFMTPWLLSGTVVLSVEDDAQVLWPLDGTFSRLLTAQSNTTASPNATTFTLRINGVSTALTVALPHSAGSASNTSDTVAVSAGDLVSLRVDTTSNGAFGNNLDILASWVFTPA
jgi:hypothetical protein